MSRFLSLVLVASVAFSLGQFLQAPIPKAGASGGSEGRGAQESEYFACADANGDGLVNVADPVHTLRFLFTEAPPPRCEAVPGRALPATGQRKCYDGNLPASEVDCASSEYPGQDGFYQAGCPSEGRFIDHGDGTVTDTCTGLMWQKDTADFNGNGRIDQNTTDTPTWAAALLYCDGLIFAGHDDWRLPNVRELQSIVGYSRTGPAIAPVFLSLSSTYWSSSSYLGYASAEYAWSINFDDGDLGDSTKWGYHYIRAVRNAP